MRDLAETLPIVPYDLPDEDLLQPQPGARRSIVFTPPRLCVVIGKGSDAGKELRAENLRADSVPVMRRASGGCAVVLSPKMVVAAIASYEQPQPLSSAFFQACNRAIMDALQKSGVDQMEFAGTSDLARAGRKIAGTAIYRNRHVVFYHAIINVAESPALIAKYLRTPPRMPDYRAGRDHEHFISSLRQEGFSVDTTALASQIQVEWNTCYHG